jgi:antibiotic biosynthesis monooxygenase (ABM) superfamily enzyme
MPLQRLLFALAGYAILALLAWFLTDGSLRLAVWVLLGGLVVRTLVAYEARRATSPSQQDRPNHTGRP